jgi:alpha-tubulin suppressor-like RCC1 family protein
VVHFSWWLLTLVLLHFLDCCLSGDPIACTTESASNPSCQTCARLVTNAATHTCVLLYDGSVKCAGLNKWGQLGRGHDHYEPELSPATVLDGIHIRSIGCGYGYTCVLPAVSQGNKVYCFGNGEDGVLGNGANESSTALVAVQGLKQTPPIVQLAVGSGYSCVLYAETGDADAVQCWGDRFGFSATTVKGTSGAKALSVGGPQACVLLKDQGVSCWTVYNYYMPEDQLLIPVRVPNVTDAVSLSSGGNGDQLVCAVVRPVGQTGSLWCWGFLDYNYEVFPSTTALIIKPYRVQSLPGNVVSVVTGAAHGCALVMGNGRREGEVYCWGENMFGVLGQGYASGTSEQPEGSKVPLRVKGLTNVTALFQGVVATCAVVSFRHVVCWGDNEDGQLATGFSGGPVTLPTAMRGLCT